MPTPKAFNTGMAKLAGLQGGLNMKERFERYAEAVKDIVDDKLFEQLVNQFLDSAKFAPTPSEMREAAQALLHKQRETAFTGDLGPDPRESGSLEKILKEVGANNLVEALEIMKRRNQGKGA